MKYLLTILGIVTAYCCSAQTYTPFPIGSAFWRYYSTFHEYGAYSVSKIQLTSTSDNVVFNGKTYYKIKVRGSGNSGGSGFPPDPDNIAEGDDADYIAIREQDKRVYMTRDGQVEYTLFDFNLNVGDMMPYVSTLRYFGGMSTEFKQEYDRINSIDKIIARGYNGRPKEIKRFNLENGSSIMEGIGGTYGLFTYLNKYEPFTLEYTCAGTEWTYCDYIWPRGTPLAVKYVPQNGLRIYPNPCTEVLHIDMNAEADLYLYNITGQQVGVYHLTGKRNTIDISQLTAGIYLASISDVKGKPLARQRLIIQ